MPSLAPPPRRMQFSRRTMTIYSALTAATFLACSAAPTPLYQHYQASFSLGPGALTLIFALYALSLLAALLTVGGLSDYIGRRPVIMTAILLNILAMVLFMTARNADALGAARIVQGFGTGMATTALGAAILDTDPKFGPLLNSVTAFAGLFCGALGSGLLVSFAPAPTMLIYLVLMCLSVLQAVLLLWMPETTRRRPGALQSLRPEVRLPREARRSFLHVSPVNVAGWALGGLNFSLMPQLVALAEQHGAPLTGTLVVATLMACAVLAVAGLRMIAAERALIVGAAALAAGMALALIAIGISSVTLVFLGVAVAGAGFGGAFSAAFRELLPRATAGDRAGLLATFYTESYLAFSLPVILAGVAVPHYGLSRTADVYGSTVIVLALVSGGLFIARIRRRAAGSGTIVQ